MKAPPTRRASNRAPEPLPRGSGRGSRWPRLAAALLLVLSLVVPARSDVFELKDGRRIEGTIIREFAQFISVKTAEGKVETFQKDQIASHEKTRSLYDDYLERKEKISADDAAAHLQLARWCEEKGLTPQATLHYKEVIRIDINNEMARDKLGFEFIGGDWYLKGSPEGEARRQELAKPFETPVRELPTKPRKERVEVRPLPTPAARPGLSSAPTVLLRLDEVVGRGAPEVPLATHRIAHFLAELKEPLFMRTEGDPRDVDYLLDLKIRVYFIRTHMFYGRTPIANLYQGEASLAIRERAGTEWVNRVVLSKIKRPFSASPELDRAEALEYAYYDLVQQLLHRLSRQDFLKKRGAKTIPAPE